MEFSLLGPLQANHDGQLHLGTPQQQRVLAMLAAYAGAPISMDEFVAEMWPGQPPPSAVAKVRGYAAALRRLFAAVQPNVRRVVRAGSGYRLVIDDADVDIIRFGQLAFAARAAAATCDLEGAARCFENALACWRGVMLDGLPRGPVLSGRCTAAEQERLMVVDDAAETYLRLGRPEQASALLWPLVMAEPLRERSHGLLIRACYRVDGVAKALEVYETLRTGLANQLGADPSAELQQLHRAVLRRHPELDQVGRV